MNKRIYRVVRADSAIMTAKIEIDRYYNRCGLELHMDYPQKGKP